MVSSQVFACHGETPHPLATQGGAERITYEAPLTNKTVAPLRCGFRARLTLSVQLLKLT
jgi:hypothetical protein